MATPFVCLMILLMLHIFTNHILHRIRNLPPSPIVCVPLIGQLYLILKRPLHRTLSEISRRHGPILFFRFGFRPVLVVSSPSAAEECLLKKDVVFANRPRLIGGKYLGYNYRSLLWAPYGEDWRNLRRISSLEIFSTHRLQTLSSIRLDEVRILVRRLYGGKSGVVDMRTEFFELMFNIMMRMIAGKRYYGDSDSEEARRFREIQEETFRVSSKTNLGDFLPVVRWAGFSKGLENSMMELQIKRDVWMQSLIEQHRKQMKSSTCHSLEKDAKKTMIEVLLSLQQTEPEYYKDDVIRGLMLVLLLAGTEGSINTMEWALSLLINHPESLQRAQMEIDDVVGRSNRIMEESDLAHLPYLRSLIQETLRMYPPGPLLIPHESSEDCHVGGFWVPAGTTLFVNVWAIQNDPSLWVEPQKFNPDRFGSSEGGGEGEGEGLKWMPFGAGRRRCPGEGLGLRVVGLAVGSLIQCFDWDSVGGEPLDMTEGVGLTLPKAIPLQALCRPRSNLPHLLPQF